jgi:ribosomal protein S12 methylthiotransferase accessory factor
VCRGWHSANFEVLVIDQTRPDARLPVARVIVPGLRHFWARLAPGRLYDVPVSLGWIRRRCAKTR